MNSTHIPSPCCTSKLILRGLTAGEYAATKKDVTRTLLQASLYLGLLRPCGGSHIGIDAMDGQAGTLVRA